MHTRWAFRAAVLLACPAACAAADDKATTPPVTPLRHAHAHNDYEHKRPLFDALDQGFGSVEADIFLDDGRLLIGHTRKALRPDRTLQRLYLDPLRERARANGGRVYPGGPTFYLLIDVKTAAQPTYAALDRVLAGYAGILSTTRDGKLTPKAVTVVVSGNRDQATMAAQQVRYAGVDGRLTDLDSDAPADLMPWVSDRWEAHFRWNGEGPMPARERDRLRQVVRKAHGHGRLVRFWATPERRAVWKELRSAGVDLINTDRLAELRQFLLDRQRNTPGK
jgi:Glycerophosphoryl diester phosphodiesterase family